MWGGGGVAQTYYCPPIKKVGGHMPPLPPPPRFLRQCSVSYYNLVCVGLYSNVAVGIPYHTHILWLLSITYQAGI